MSVEGKSKSSIARIKGISWNTVARWIERADDTARRFNSAMTQGSELKQLQADAIRTFLQHKDRPIWVFEGQLELLRCYYNFVRPHRGLTLGQEMRTPAMQAGLVKRRLTFREIFTSAAVIFLLVLIVLEHCRRFDRVKLCRKAA